MLFVWIAAMSWNRFADVPAIHQEIPPVSHPIHNKRKLSYVQSFFLKALSTSSSFFCLIQWRNKALLAFTEIKSWGNLTSTWTVLHLARWGTIILFSFIPCCTWVLAWEQVLESRGRSIFWYSVEQFSSSSSILSFLFIAAPLPVVS